jgi:hypothetical protein
MHLYVDSFDVDNVSSQKVNRMSFIVKSGLQSVHPVTLRVRGDLLDPRKSAEDTRYGWPNSHVFGLGNSCSGLLLRPICRHLRQFPTPQPFSVRTAFRLLPQRQYPTKSVGQAANR